MLISPFSLLFSITFSMLQILKSGGDNYFQIYKANTKNKKLNPMIKLIRGHNIMKNMQEM
ncbi:hypothetical protein BIV60_07045 [Bacillus sp. MUM 116]|nr:hypothetical protein BIV60_07045 [Bacillus sp. MUM 116]